MEENNHLSQTQRLAVQSRDSIEFDDSDSDFLKSRKSEETKIVRKL